MASVQRFAAVTHFACDMQGLAFERDETLNDLFKQHFPRVTCAKEATRLPLNFIFEENNEHDQTSCGWWGALLALRFQGYPPSP